MTAMTRYRHYINIAAGIVISSCSQPAETLAQYAANPVGCEAMPADWYAEQGRTAAGRRVLQERSRVTTQRGEFHRQQIDFVSISRDERQAHIGKALTCLREAQWSQETLAKAGESW